MATSDLIGRNFGASPAWDDLRVPVTATTAAGSSPPSFALFRNDGVQIPNTFSLVFDGDNDIATIPHDDSGATPVFDFAASWSLSFWAIIPANVGNNKYIFYHPQWSIRTRPLNEVRVALSGYAEQTSSSQYNAGSKTHFVLRVTEAGGNVTLELFIDGQSAIDTTFSGTLTADGGGDVSVGAVPGPANNCAMTLDNVRFFDAAISDDDIADLYNAGDGTEADVSAGDRVSYYKLNDGTGNEADDDEYPGATTHIMSLSGPVWLSGGLVSAEGGASRGVYTYFFSPDVVQELHFTAQLPHTWIEYASLHPHVHWSPEDNVAGNVVWGLEYTWQSVGRPFGNTTTVRVVSAAGGEDYHLLNEYDPMEGADQVVSSMLICRLFRDADHEEDTYPGQAALLEIDIHYQGWERGSEAEYYR